MFKEYISDEHMANMAAEAARSMDPESYETGRIYYRSGRVEWTKLFGDRIYSVVNDGKKNTVVIHIDDFSESVCACVKKHFCEHIAAVFLHYYEPWLASNESKFHGNPTLGKTSKKNRLPQLRRQVLNAPVKEEGPVEGWQKYFEREYIRVVGTPKRYPQYCAGYPLDEAHYLFNKFVAATSAHSKTWQPIIRNIYLFHSILFFMTGLERDAENVVLSYMGSYQIKGIEEGFARVLDPLISAMLGKEYRQFFQKALELIRENFLREKRHLFAWIYIYRLLCVAFQNSRDLLERETGDLEKIMKGLQEDRQGYYYAALGLAGLKMTAQKSGEALAILQKLKRINIEDMFFYLRYLAEKEKWDSLLTWLCWLNNKIRTAENTFLEAVCGYCLSAVEKSGRGEDFISLIRSWLPRSFDSYAAYLLGAGQYREWVEFNISYLAYGHSSDKSLRYLELHQPAVLIPFYHQWAARLIEEKNRNSYRAAVGVLKKLRNLYKKEKMVKEWNMFISRLALRYSRLRAFREELRKGKLIS